MTFKGTETTALKIPTKLTPNLNGFPGTAPFMEQVILLLCKILQSLEKRGNNNPTHFLKLVKT